MTTLYGFQCSSDGAYPKGGVVLDADDTIYGTTSGGGAFSYGTVFQLTQ